MITICILYQCEIVSHGMSVVISLVGLFAFPWLVKYWCLNEYDKHCYNVSNILLFQNDWLTAGVLPLCRFCCVHHQCGMCQSPAQRTWTALCRRRLDTRSNTAHPQIEVSHLSTNRLESKTSFCFVLMSCTDLSVPFIYRHLYVKVLIWYE